MFLDKKTLFKIWLNPELNLTIFRGSGAPDHYWGRVVQLLANFFLALLTVPESFAKVYLAQFSSLF